MSRIFDEFPQGGKPCPICRTSRDGKTILIPIPGTQEDNICEAHPVHLDCAGIVATTCARALGVIPTGSVNPNP